MKNLLYNNDGTLSTEAQFLISLKPDDMSLAEWRKRFKQFKSQLSVDDLEKFDHLRKKANNVHKKWYAKKWYAENSEKVKRDSKARYAKNPEKAKQAVKAWHAKNPEKRRQYSEDWRVKNPEQHRQYMNDYNKQYMNDYHKQRRAKDPLYHLRCNMRSLGNRVVKQLALGKKPACTEKWQGCTAEELKTHLESLFTEGMTWENYGKHGWHVDHIRPVSSFTAEEWEQINHYTNLQPLWAKDNITKSDNY